MRSPYPIPILSTNQVGRLNTVAAVRRASTSVNGTDRCQYVPFIRDLQKLILNQTLSNCAVIPIWPKIDIVRPVAKLTAFPPSIRLWELRETGRAGHHSSCMPQPRLYLFLELLVSSWARRFTLSLLNRKCQ